MAGLHHNIDWLVWWGWLYGCHHQPCKEDKSSEQSTCSHIQTLCAKSVSLRNPVVQPVKEKGLSNPLFVFVFTQMYTIYPLLHCQSSSNSVGKSIWPEFRRPRFKSWLDLNVLCLRQTSLHLVLAFCNINIFFQNTEYLTWVPKATSCGIVNQV